MGKSSLDSLSQGFARLTHLKIFTYAIHEEHYAMNSWPVILGVLKWCRNCKYLLIKQSYFEMGSFPSWERPILDTIRDKLLPHLSWMRSLKSLVILRPGIVDHPKDDVLLFLLNWLFDGDQNHSPWSTLERLWIDGNPLQVLAGSVANGPFVKSSFCHASDWTNTTWLLHHGRFRHLEHLGGILTFQHFDYLPDLKYAQGIVRTIPTQGFQQFCLLHPMLEYLHITLRYKSHQQLYNFDETWKLPLLKVLVYNDTQYPNHGLLSRLVKAACSNLQELHLEVDFNKREASRFFSNIHQFRQLTFLTVKMPSKLEEWHNPQVTETLPSIDLKGCPKLERLYLTNCHSPHTLLSQLKYRIELPVNNLRDLRLEWGNFTSFGPFELSSLLMELTQASPRIQRLVLCSKKNTYQAPDPIHQLENSLFTFVSEMKHLVVLCFVGFEMDHTVLEVVKRRLIEKIIPNRPSFWFYFDQLPNGYDVSIPRIHYEEIVNPADWSCAPPPL